MSDKAKRPDIFANEPFVRGKACRAIDIYYFPDGTAKITFLQKIPKDREDGTTTFIDKTFYEFVKGVEKGTSLDKISLQNLRVISVEN